jgi:hypothetical protein
MEARVRDRLETLLERSTDPGNPGPEELVHILRVMDKVAVVGISRDPAKAARRVPSFLSARGATIIPVNPNADRILGRKAHDRLEDVQEPVDIVLVFRPSKDTPPIVRAAAARPERPVIWLQEGILAGESAEEAREEGILVVQDLCLYKVFRAAEEEVRRTAAPPSLA